MADNAVVETFSRTDLEEQIKYDMGVDTLTPLIDKQINRFRIEYGYTYKEIAQAVSYYHEQLKGTFSSVYGIGVVPNVMKEAQAYFKKLKEEREKQELEAQKIVQSQDNNIIFNVKSLTYQKRKPKQLDINKINISEGEDDND